jgi:hypothetical protein
MGILQSSPLLECASQPAGTLAVLKEYSAALLWVDAPLFLVAALKNLPADARATLCALFGLLRTQLNPDALAHRITNFVQAKRAQNASRTSTQGGSGVAPATQAAQAATESAVGAWAVAWMEVVLRGRRWSQRPRRRQWLRPGRLHLRVSAWPVWRESAPAAWHPRAGRLPFLRRSTRQQSQRQQ